MTWSRVVRGLASAPLTFTWLAVLFGTTRRQRVAGERRSRRMQRENSTNLRRLRADPLRVLVASLFWTDDRRWWPYVPLFVAVVAPAERRLRWWRWLAIGLAAHVVATYVGQGHLGWRIRRGTASRRLVDARDVGVSYFALGVAGTLTAYVDGGKRSSSRVALLAALGVNAAVRPTYTEVGHLTAFAVGVSASFAVPERGRAPYPSPGAVALATQGAEVLRGAVPPRPAGL